MPLLVQETQKPSYNRTKGKWKMHEETSVLVQEKLNPPIVKQKRSKKIPTATTPAEKTLKIKSRQKLVIQ